MGIWIELGVFVLALAFGLWQIRDVRKAQAATRRQRERERAEAARTGSETGGEPRP